MGEPNGRLDGFSISKDRSEEYMAESEADPDEPKETKPEIETETSRLLELANTIQAQVTQIQKYLTETKQPNPRFEATEPSVDWEGADDTRSDCIENLAQLTDLLYTPRETLHSLTPTNLMSRHAIDRFKIHCLIPLEGSRSYEDLAWATMLPVKTLRRILRQAMSQRVFYEPQPGYVAHTHASRLLAEDSSVRDYFGTICQEVWPAAARCVDAVETWPGGTGKDESGYQLANGRTLYETLAAEPAKQKRYDSAHGAFNNDRTYSYHHTVTGYDWASLGEGAVIVDVGGGIGNASRTLAKAFPNLRFIVEDREDVVKNAVVEDPDIKDRIEFVVHDFFQAQPVKDADLYLFRRVMMEWTDEQAADMIAKLKPALKKGAIVQIQDPYMPEPGFCPIWQERKYRDSDLLALALANGGSREEGEWERIFQMAGPGFEFKGVSMLKHSNMAFIEAVWTREAEPEVVPPNEPESAPEQSRESVWEPKADEELAPEQAEPKREEAKASEQTVIPEVIVNGV